MKGVFTKPLSDADVRLLDAWRRKYWDADLELPHDFNADGVYSVAAHKNFRTFASLTGTSAVVYDPFIHDPDFENTETGARDLLFALVKLDTVLSEWAQERGAVDAFIAIPKQLVKYIRLLQNYGWEPTAQNCVIMRRPLRPDTVPMLGLERAEQARLAALAHNPDESPKTVE